MCPRSPRTTSTRTTPPHAACPGIHTPSTRASAATLAIAMRELRSFGLRTARFCLSDGAATWPRLLLQACSNSGFRTGVLQQRVPDGAHLAAFVRGR